MVTTIYAVVSRKQYACGTYAVLTQPYNRLMETIADRLRRLMTEQGLSQYKLWKGSGVSQPTIKRILDGTSKEPDKGTVVKLAAALGCNYAYLYDGGALRQTQEMMYAPPATASPISYKDPSELDPDDYVFIDRYDVKLSAGNGNAVWVIREKDPLSFRAAWFKKKGLHPEACKALYVRGRSMEPKLEDWDTVLVDTSDTDLIDGEIYAVTYKDQFYIKTLERQGDGVLLKSENPDHKSIMVPEDDLGRLRILGRKVWRGG